MQSNQILMKTMMQRILVVLICSCHIGSVAWSQELKAGAFARSIDPQTFPVWVNGGIAGKKADRVLDTLFVRCLVLEESGHKVAIAIVDNCILPHEVTDTAKTIIQKRMGLPPECVLIAATHTHSAVSVAGVHGCPVQDDYAKELPSWIADGIASANDRLQPAQYGTASVVSDKFIHCRDWLMKPGKARSTPFSGRTMDDVSMNPGFENADKLAPVGTIDRVIPILSIQDLEGRAIALLASFSTHYAGAKPLSSDYFGVVAKKLGKAMRPDDPDAFVGLMANATSGNANCIDFSKPREPFTYVDVGDYIADQILSVVPTIKYSSQATLDSAFNSFDAPVRMPKQEEVDEAKAWVKSNLGDRLPKTMDENYARETILLSELPATRRMNLQAFRLGDFAIAANPCESYCETGLKIRQASPFSLTMNIGLANGHCGYIPPPEMFQLGGYATWRCRSSCLNEQAEPTMVEGITNLLADLNQRKVHATVPLTKNVSLPNSPLSPLQSLGAFELEEGFAIELVASEPQVVDPVSMQIDEKGRMWVVEMRDYPSGVEEPQCRIVVLEDHDADGMMETSHTFAEGLQFATGLQPWRDGVLVTVEEKLLFLRDTDGDLKADKIETWLTGFSKSNSQLRANHPTITADGWLTIASGLRGGVISLDSSLGNDHPAIDIAGSDVRFHLVRKNIESITGPSQFGLSFDNVGRRYGCSNRQPCFEIVADREDVNISPLAGFAPSLNQALPSEANSKVYPLINAWTTSTHHAGQFTAACGVCVTHSELFGSPESTTVLTCEPTGGLVQRKVLSRVNGFGTERESHSSLPSGSHQREWLASHDPWFRPVDLYEGPDGAIYIVDMYRAVIEHPEWVPSELKNRPDQRMGDSQGRIYRVVKTTTKDNRSRGLSKPIQDVAQAIDCLSRNDSWLQRQASRMILQAIVGNDFSESSESKLRDLLQNSSKQSNISTANQCAGLLSAAGKFVQQDLLHMLDSPQQEIQLIGLSVGRQVAHSLSHVAIDQKAIDAVTSCVASEDAEESRLAGWLLARLPSDYLFPQSHISATVNQVLLRPNDRHLWMSVAAMYRNQMDEFVKAYLNAAMSTSNSADAMTEPSVEALALEKLVSWHLKQKTSDSSRYFVTAAKLVQEKDSKFSNRAVAVGLGVLLGVNKTGKADLLSDEFVAGRLNDLASPHSPKELRIQAIRLLGRSSNNHASDIVQQHLEDSDKNIVQEVINALGKADSPSFLQWLLSEYATAPSDVRQSMFAAIRNHPHRLERFLEALESKQISIRLLDASQLQSLRTIDSPQLRAKIGKLISSSVNKDREKIVLEYSEQLRGRIVGNDPSIGKALFKTNCAGCHQVDGIGTSIGPNISDSREHTYEKLLVAVLDPNRAIDANYFRYLALTDEGETVEGLLRESNAQSVTLENRDGVKRLLNRDELLEFKSTGTSMMPEGIESQISVEQMGELIWYLKNWRYVAQNVPATAKLP
ncbi:MAG: HEAT repeat domain-containing protein [Planctomycetota bacterium]|nr:HEAT repeat domain-containing protein [Planctomycetota bacterium]